MKTAISLNDGLARAADETARQLGLSRSRLFAVALGEFIERRRRQEMQRRLDDVYGGAVEPAEKPILKGVRTAFGRTVRERW
jgi:metal-responsive CopG/Arc/MetJ family transcriptional regulator